MRLRYSWELAREIIRGLPRQVFYLGGGLGDVLLTSAVVHELTLRKDGRSWLVTHTPALLRSTSSVRVIDSKSGVFRLLNLFGVKATSLGYTERDWANDKDVAPAEPIIAAMCRIAGIRGSVELRPYLKLTDEERAAANFASGKVVMMSSGLSAKFAMLNKEWVPERFQEVADRLGQGVIQVGDRSDPELVGSQDLRGRLSVRETAAVISNAACFVGQVGFLMHLARSVDTPAVIVYGGRETPEQSGYSVNVNLYRQTACSPCWRWNTCEYGRECMKMVSVDDVHFAINKVLDQQLPRPLTADVALIAGD